MSGIPGTAVIQITNLSSSVNSEQMRTLFGFLGDIEELRLYPPDNTPLSFSSKVCYVKYREPSSVGVAQHLTNTVFIDRALIVVPCAEGKIPEEAKALSLLAPATPVASLMPGGGLLPIPSTAQLQNLALPLATRGPQPPGRDTSVAALSATPPQPPIMGNVDPSKIDEIRRTVYVGNLNSQGKARSARPASPDVLGSLGPAHTRVPTRAGNARTPGTGTGHWGSHDSRRATLVACTKKARVLERRNIAVHGPTQGTEEKRRMGRRGREMRMTGDERKRGGRLPKATADPLDPAAPAGDTEREAEVSQDPQEGKRGWPHQREEGRRGGEHMGGTAAGSGMRVLPPGGGATETWSSSSAVPKPHRWGQHISRRSWAMIAMVRPPVVASVRTCLPTPTLMAATAAHTARMRSSLPPSDCPKPRSS
ncbi:splicing regulatory glutamine/lysine-rich protein 1 isoform X6 [Brachyhypopomus gauderio]|uniref:splicing regulatory glutamine/lysine-rich protein 1 isoform X6 n=1 Tax=Brachyhypopomus gauderio TaxID=698409 RepID=UPI004042CF21